MKGRTLDCESGSEHQGAAALWIKKRWKSCFLKVCLFYELFFFTMTEELKTSLR